MEYAPMSSGAATHLYVYYRVAADAAAARATVAVLMSEVETATGVVGRLLVRCDDPATWMEVYEPIEDTKRFSLTLAALVAQHGVAAIAADGHRHTECFAPLAATAG